MISGHRSTGGQELMSAGELRMFIWALINIYGYRDGERKG